MKEIKLTQGKVALVDDEDWGFLHLVNWYALRRRHIFYAVRKVPKPSGGRKTEPMHRVVLARKLGREITPGMMPDHKDGDGLNNQRYNLSEVTHRGNQENQHIAKTSQYLGVSWDKESGKWKAQIGVSPVGAKRKGINLGRYATELEAALAREAYINAHPELNAGSNFIKK